MESAAAWAILACQGSTISLVAAGALRFPNYVDSIVAEFTGAELALGALLRLSRGYPDIVPHAADSHQEIGEAVRVLSAASNSD